MRKGHRAHHDSLGFKYRSALSLMTMLNKKTPYGEEADYLTAILYLAPHTAGAGKTVCSHSTPACRQMCLAGAGLSGLAKQLGAKMARTDLFNNARETFLAGLRMDIDKLATIARREGMKPVVRLNGTSDILWERLIDMGAWPALQFMDYTKVPIERRRIGPNYHLTYSVGGPEDMARAVGYLRNGQSVAVVVPEALKAQLAGTTADLGAVHAGMVDGDLNDLRFLDPPGSIVLLKPKGHVTSDLMRPNIVQELRAAA